jgi:hypothetical protein
MKAICAVCLLIVPFLQQAYGWGQEGHSIIAEIAQHRLNDKTLRTVQKLIGQNVSLASVASWADDYRSGHPDTGGWHFVNIPDDRATYDPAVDCVKGNCVVDAIARFVKVLADCANSMEERQQALKFVVHFVGDIHQPLHSSDRWDGYTGRDYEGNNLPGKDDLGGNTIKVTFFGTDTNLHAVWDTGLIMHTVYNWGAYVGRLETGWLAQRDVTDLSGGTPIDWAVEAHKFGHEIAYKYPDDGILGLEYLHKSQPVVDRQLALAGVRLARLLNETLQPTRSCP